MTEEEYLFPMVGPNGVLQPGVPLAHDKVQKLLDGALAGADIPGKFSTHCFRRGGAQYRFMSAPLGERWSLRCVRFWGGWAEGEQVSVSSEALISDMLVCLPIWVHPCQTADLVCFFLRFPPHRTTP